MYLNTMYWRHFVFECICFFFKYISIHLNTKCLQYMYSSICLVFENLTNTCQIHLNTLKYPFGKNTPPSREELTPLPPPGENFGGTLSCNGSFRTEHPRGEAVANVSCRNVKLSQRGCSVRVEQLKWWTLTLEIFLPLRLLHFLL